MRTLPAGLALLLLLAGCGDSPRSGAEAAPGAGEPTSSSPTASADREMLVPDVVAMPVAAAQAALERAGLTARRVEGAGSACVPAGEVVGQRPAAGRSVPIGSRVTVEVSSGGSGVCGLGLPPAPAELDRVARLFLRFARGEGPPPVDTPVDLYLGGRFVETVPTTDTLDRAAWEVCPEGGSYAGATCPFSVLEPLAGSPRVAVTSRDPQHPCAHPSPLPGAVEGRSVTLQPDEALACPSWFAVQLLVNDVGQVTAVNLVHSEP
ncbi:PASTA domain-containing protein [Nocardioides marmotae]|uniref:PASTA domain-containing protein n=1 Tax=Nocardioides marmotae TaxID=2663857 RepID=UPI0012B57696|nr:PASTA domain-containing protein [Nocardioides marmotae]MBC9732447.1 PASTA domain-containing protein [Nocardioides marmotae]MTB83566.1 PASTA domain-containing protein [Nocardioides marmotae]